jgi:two-component system LytT family response regulator
MAMVKAVIIDDEPHGIRSLEALIREYCPSLVLAGTAASIDDGQKLLEETQPDILFLDIEMPNGSGFELLKNIGTRKSFELIFTTAYQHYAIQAIRENALDYLLKPIYPEELITAVDKACKRIQSPQGNKEKKFDELFSRLEKLKLKRLAIPGVDEIHYVDLDHVVRLEASSNYTEIFLTGGKKHLVSRTLKDFEEQLSGAGFFRVHKAHLINIAHVDRYVRQDGGYILMKDGTSIPVSRPRRDELLRALSG